MSQADNRMERWQITILNFGHSELNIDGGSSIRIHVENYDFHLYLKLLILKLSKEGVLSCFGFF